jgi:hypothetical protein
VKNIGFRNVLTGILAASCCTQLTPLAAAATLTLTKFADPNIPSFSSKGTIGFTYAGNKFVGSVYSGGQLYSTDLTGGSVAAFGPANVLNSGQFEHYVTSSLGLGGFPLRDIYVGDIRCTVGSCVTNDPNLENSIVHITNDGTSSNKFVGGLCTSGGICGAVRGILFDSVGTFGYNMLVSTHLGNIYQITSGGTVTLLASVGEDAEGMDLIPSGAIFGSFAGQLIVASETSGLLRGITPAGVVTVLNPSAPITEAEVVVFVPTNFGLSGNPLEGLYESNFATAPTTAVFKADASQFSTLRGDLIVTTEGSPPALFDIHWDGTKFVQTTLAQFPPQPEDGILVTPAIIAGGCTSSLGMLPRPGAVPGRDRCVGLLLLSRYRYPRRQRELHRDGDLRHRRSGRRVVWPFHARGRNQPRHRHLLRAANQQPVQPHDLLLRSQRRPVLDDAHRAASRVPAGAARKQYGHTVDRKSRRRPARPDHTADGIFDQRQLRRQCYTTVAQQRSTADLDPAGRDLLHRQRDTAAILLDSRLS